MGGSILVKSLAPLGTDQAVFGSVVQWSSTFR